MDANETDKGLPNDDAMRANLALSPDDRLDNMLRVIAFVRDARRVGRSRDSGSRTPFAAARRDDE